MAPAIDWQISWDPPRLEQTWTANYNYNLVGKDRLPTGKQSYDLTGRPPEQIQLHAWTWSYNLNLVAKDRMIVGDQVYNLTVAQITPPDQIQLRSWQWSYNLNLRGQDRLAVGKQFSDRPQLPPTLDYSFIFPINVALNPPIVQVGSPVGAVYTARPTLLLEDWRRDWGWSYNFNLVGKDRLPTGEQVFDLAPGQKPPEQVQLHSWQWVYNLNLIGKDALVTGEQVYDLPPRDPREVRTWTWQYNLNLIAKDRLPTGAVFWDRPTLPIPPAQTWTQAIFYPAVKPFLQSDWPTPTPPYRIDQAWEYWYNLNLVGQDRFPTGEQIWERPQLPVPPAATWIDVTKIWLTAPVLNITITQYYDRPALPAPPAQTWTASYNQNLIAQDKMVTGEQFTELPPKDFLRLLQTWIQQTNLALLTAPPIPDVSISQYYDRPTLPIPPARSWEFSFNLNLIAQDVLPSRQSDWPLTPAAQRSVDLSTWIDRAKFILQKPTAQLDWPNPTQPARDPTLATITESFNLNLRGQDRLPNRQQDWPLPAPAPQPMLQIMVQGKWFNLVPIQALPPGVQLYARSIDPARAAADIAWPAWRWPQITPPVVTTQVPLRTLMGTGI